MPAPGFGSFNSGNVEDMISDPEWTPPQPPSFLEDLDGAVGATCGFGAAMRACFLLEPGWTFVNHGAFGAPLAAAFEVSSRWRRYAEQQPLRFIDRELFPYLVKVTKQMAAHLCVDARDLVLVPNATTALNAVVQSVPLQPGDEVLFFDCTYASVKKMVRKVCAACGAVASEKALPQLNTSLTASALADAVARLIPDHCKLVILDHVTSNEAMELPLDLLVPLCQEKGALVLVDGAHGLGATHLDVAAIGAEYYAGNCHKWFCAPRGVGFLHVNHARLRERAPAAAARPRDIPVVVCGDKVCERVAVIKATPWGGVTNPITSHGYGAGFLSQFVWDGARDYSAFLALEFCLAFWRETPDALSYSHALLCWAAAFLTARWDSETLLQNGLCAKTMCLVRLPSSVQDSAGKPAVPPASMMTLSLLSLQRLSYRRCSRSLARSLARSRFPTLSSSLYPPTPPRPLRMNSTQQPRSVSPCLSDLSLCAFKMARARQPAR